MATQNLKGIEAIRRTLTQVSSPSFRSAVLLSLSEEARKLAVDGFQQSTSPYGKKWQPLKFRDGKPLLDTGVLRNSLKGKPTASGISISSNLEYAATHNYGRGSIPKRQFLPDRASGLGAKWTRAFRRTIESALKAVR